MSRVCLYYLVSLFPFVAELAFAVVPSIAVHVGIGRFPGVEGVQKIAV